MAGPGPGSPEEPLLPILDDPPKGRCVDHDELVLNDEEIALGNRLGAEIDTEDDWDVGEGIIEIPRVTRATAPGPAGVRAQAERLRTALLDNGVRKVSLELQADAQGMWRVAPFVRNLSHHIVSRPPGTPGLALVKRGRSDLRGPLCNGYGGFDLCARIITLGYANHPGLGGPWSVPGWGTVPKDNGRAYLFGWEFEGGILEWTDEMHDFMARCNAGTLDWLGSLTGKGPAPITCQGEHKTWAPGRKIDRLGYTTSSGRYRIEAVRKSAPSPAKKEGFLMALTDKQQEQLRADVEEIKRSVDWLTKPVINEVTPAQSLRNTANATAEALTLARMLLAKSKEKTPVTVELSEEDLEALAESLKTSLPKATVDALAAKLSG